MIYLFLSTTIFLDTINIYGLPAINPGLKTVTYGCYTYTVPWFLTKAYKGQGVLCLRSLIYILCFKNKMGPSRQVWLSNTVYDHVTDHELAGSKSSLTHLDFGAIASTDIKIIRK